MPACRRSCLPTKSSPRSSPAALEGVDVRRISDPGPEIDAVDSLLDLIGNTPMMRLDRTAKDVECTLLGKLELFNPGGSSKDRIALCDDRRSGTRKLARSRVDDRRTDERQHRGRSRHCRREAPLQVRVRLPGQGRLGQNRPPARLRRRGRRLPDVYSTRAPGLVLLGL